MTVATVSYPVGADHATAINAAISSVAALGGGVVRLTESEYRISSKLVMQSNVALVGTESGGTQLLRAASWLPSGADDPTNCMVQVAGAVVGGGFSSTLSARANRGDTTLTITTTAGMAVSRRYRLQGNNANDEGMSEGANQLTTEIVEIASVDSGTAVTLKWPCQVHHASGHTVVEVTTVSDVVLAGLRLSAEGGSHAAGVHVRMGERVRMFDLDVSGFSRAAIDCDHGAWDVQIDGVYSRGEVNSIVAMDSAHGFSVRGVRCSPSGLRYHAAGVARALLWVPNDCNAGKFTDCELRRGTQAIAIRSGHNIHVANTTVDDFVPDEGYTRQVAAGEHTGGSQFGIVTGGANPSDYNARTQGVTMHRVSVGECFTTNAAAEFYCFFLHDTYQGVFDGLRAQNTGKGNTSSGNLMRGLRATDCGSTLANYVCKGYLRGLVLKGTTGLDKVLGYTYDFTAGTGNGEGGLEIDIAVAPSAFRDVWINANFPFLFGTTKPPHLRIHRFTNASAGTYADEVQLLCNKTGGIVNVMGGVYEIDQATSPAISGIVQFKTPTGVVGRNTCVVIAGNTADGEVCLAALLPQRCTARVRNEGAARAPGGLLETVNAQTELAFNAGSTNPSGRLLELHASGAAALRHMGAP